MAAAASLAVLLLGMVFAAAAERLLRGGSPLATACDSARLLLQQRVSTERPDALNLALAPLLYFALAAIGLSVVPLAPELVVASPDAGIVLWGACEALTVVAVFLHGWSANAPLPLIGAYRYVAVGLPAMLLSMFVLIGTALPAESLSLPAIVESQRDGWNLLRQPLGLPLFLLLGLTLSLRGPFDYGDSTDLAGGTQAEASGRARLGWRVAKLAMLVSFSAVAASAFLGGYLGPLLPPPLWLLLKSAAVLLLVLALERTLARMPPARMMTLLWVVLTPLAFVDLLVAGLGALR